MYTVAQRPIPGQDRSTSIRKSPNRSEIHNIAISAVSLNFPKKSGWNPVHFRFPDDGFQRTQPVTRVSFELDLTPIHHLLALEAFGFASEPTGKVERLNALLTAATG